MADNTVLNVATTVGDTIRNVAKAGGVKTHVCVIDVGGSGTEKLLGDVGAVLPVSGTVIAGLAAGTSLIGQVAAGQQLATIYAGAIPLTVQSAAINVSTAGWTTLVAGQAGKKITVLGFTLVCGAAVVARFAGFDGTATYTDLTGPLSFAANSGAGASISPLGQFATPVGHGLAINLASAALVGGYLVYTQG